MWRALKPLGLFFLFFFSVSPNDADLVYRAEGEDVILRPPPMTGAIQHIEWKHNNNNTAAEWSGNEVHCLGQFEGRCEVNTETGALTVKGLKLTDSGNYTPEINGEDFSKIELSVISRVAKPSVNMSCNIEMTNCNLTCEGNTADAEPITYKWFVDDVEGPSGQKFLLTEFFTEHSYRCLMMNPVSNETSESITNPVFICGKPFIEQERNWPVSILVPVAVVGLIFLLIVILFAVFIYKHIRERRQGAQYGTLEKDTEWEKEIEKV
ncbi:uncharacterized protein LOC121506663 isoform X1 [Cheilinus undulatus]|uniref:uncharacterized protein LOC121506663 isoform X1 n=1 Tax=Cheilinus undulatus TaxID=241271 RepID=UPI001BD5DAF5|nr:uncharacterized protein LOC121506663 isoform X1 [Cheilinus undulatus]